MEPITKEQLLERALQIKEETQIGANTADRVGGLLVDMISYLSSITSLAIKSVPEIEDINVDNGTEIEALVLPETVEVTLINDKSKTLAVSWDTASPTYDGDIAETYTFTGTIILEIGYANPLSLTVTVDVIVAEA